MADTFFFTWNPYFQVTKDTRWGWTKPVTKPRGTQGVPEVVHRGWQQNKPNVMTDQFEFLGDI